MICYILGENYEKIYDGIFWMEKFKDYPIYHSHNYWEFVLCKSGTFDHTINGKHQTLETGDAVLLAPGDSHSLKATSDKVIHLNIGISNEAFEQRCSAINPEFCNFFKQKRFFKVKFSFERLAKIESHLKSILISSNKDEIATSVSFVIFNIFEPIYTKTKTEHSEMPEWFKDLLVQCNSFEHLSWKPRDVYKYANYSQAHISRMFKKILNTTLVDYLLKIKMNNAVVLLTNSDLSLTAIVSTLGYNSISYFSNTFKKYYKVPPYHYKLQFHNRNA